MDWRNETAVRDAFVEAVHAGDHAAASNAGTVLVNKSFEDEFSVLDEVESGVLLTEALIPQGPDNVYDSAGLALLKELLPSERFAAFLEGAALSAAEHDLWQRRAAEHILGSIGDLDWDTYSMWTVYRVRHFDRRVAYLADVGGGYAFDGPWREYRGGATTLDEALALLKRHGYISVDDFRERNPTTPPVSPSTTTRARRGRRRSDRRGGAAS